MPNQYTKHLQPPYQPTICLFPGCYLLSTHSRLRGFCPHHYNVVWYRRWGRSNQESRDNVERSKRINEYVLNKRTPRYNKEPHPPLSKRQQRIRDRELNILLTFKPAKDQLDYLQKRGSATMWARKGGKKAYFQFLNYCSRQSWYGRRSLRTGRYDPSLIKPGLKRRY